MTTPEHGRVDETTLQRTIAMQNELIEACPGWEPVDPHDPTKSLAIIMAYSVFKGESFKFFVGDGQANSGFEIAVDDSVEGSPYMVRPLSADGTLSETAATIAASLIHLADSRE